MHLGLFHRRPSFTTIPWKDSPFGTLESERRLTAWSQPALNHVRTFVFLIFAILLSAEFAAGSEEFDEEESTYLPGLVAEYSRANHRVARLDDDLRFDWGDSSPDAALPNGPFLAVWKGHLFVQKGGAYRFSARLGGRLTFRLGEQFTWQTVADGEIRVSEAIDLEFGYHPLAVEFESGNSPARLLLAWGSDQFEMEPIPTSAFVHESSDDRGSRHRWGESLVRAYRCAACHELPASSVGPKGPSLAKIRGTVYPDWLVEYLGHPSGGKEGVSMPDFGLSVEEAKAVASYLWARSERWNSRSVKLGDASVGEQLAQRIGCLACHKVGDAGKNPRFGGGTLDRIAEKRPAAFFASWLKTPHASNSDHRMPILPLEPKEVDDLASFLATLGTAKGAPNAINIEDPTLVARGRELIAKKRCASCHQMVGATAAPRMAWRVGSLSTGKGQPGCLGEPAPANDRPGYRLPGNEAAALIQFLQILPTEKIRLGPAVVGPKIIEENNCLACHRRGNAQGLLDVVAQLGITDTKKRAALVPPALTSVGDKLQPEWLADAVTGKAPRLRPWLSPRMPQFRHAKEEIHALVTYLESHDRQLESSPGPGTPESDVTAQERLFAAHRLVGGNGFGCMSCHSIGKYQPAEIEPGARGSDLLLLGKRMRQSWFRRWTRDPSRIVPGSEMPAITLAVPGVLDGNVDRQLDALWHGLNSDALKLPTSDAVQTLAANPKEPVIILRDVFELGETSHVPRAFAVGLANGHNLLFDLDSFSIRRWWVGDFARQKTRGKTWYWESAGPELVDVEMGVPLVALRDRKQPGSTLVEPVSRVQAIGSLRSFSRTGDSAELAYQLGFGAERGFTVKVILGSDPAGIRLLIQAIPAAESTTAVGDVSFEPILRMRVPADATNVGASEVEFTSTSGTSRCTIADAGGPMEFQEADDKSYKQVLVPLRSDGDGWRGEVLFASAAKPPLAPVRPTLAEIPRPIRKLPTVPGYEVLRLPVGDGPMPTAMAWRPDGSMVLTDLKGGVYTVHDGDGDGLLDQYRLFSDHLAAPFGLMAEGEDIVVIHKPELLRLSDRDGDGRADYAEVLATGWGVTFDYHDWSVGLVQDQEKAYYIAPSVQQDSRSRESAIGRGKVLRIARDGSVEEFAAGIRFAMGMAMNAAGEIFATDNQGNSNPFNELNHVCQGKHYGFWNKLERREKDQAVELPAIQIPHPWSRSVNGIAFIPPGDAFGPFAGHLIGAEYTNRGLIRMSLDKVGDTYQGCAYPFSDATQEMRRKDETFLGPIAVSFGPDGCLYVGSMIDSGWGGGNNRGTIERVRFSGSIPFGIREVRAHALGFDIDFTGPVDETIAADPKRYTVVSYQRIPMGSYETPDQDRASMTVERVEIRSDGLSARLFVRPMRPTFVYEIGIGSLGKEKSPPFPAIAYYTLHQIPASLPDGR